MVLSWVDSSGIHNHARHPGKVSWTLSERPPRYTKERFTAHPLEQRLHSVPTTIPTMQLRTGYSSISGNVYINFFWHNTGIVGDLKTLKKNG